MKLSVTSSAVYGVRTGGQLQFLPELGIAQCAQAGFDRMEYNFQAGPAGAKPLSGDNWKDTVSRLQQVLEENHISVPYTHDYWYILSQAKNPASIERMDTMIRRSVEASHMLGSRLMVTHTQSVYDAQGYNADRTWEYNYAFYSEIGQQAAKYGIDIAVENLFPIAGAIDFSSYPEEMAQLMERLNDPIFGICWDFGHANMAKLDHEQALEVVAPWLRLIHADDNLGTSDIHTVPGYGNVPWDKIMPKLKAVGYRGDLNLSVRTFAQTTLPEQRVEALRFLHRTGSELIRMYDED